ncbi:MAG: hypothetical protein ACOX9C_03900 [Kiritimatiellia bacterium]|jgi:hypothetical protein
MNPHVKLHTIPRLFAVIPAAILLGSSPLAHAATVSAPYDNDFSTSAADFTVAPTNRWIHLPTLGIYSNEYKSTTTTAGIEVGNLGKAAATAKPFTYAVDFKFLDGNGTVSYVGVCFLSGAGNLPDTDGYRFYQVIATPNSTGIPLFLKRNNVTVASGTSFMQFRHTKGTAYRWEVKGVYVDTDADGVNDALELTAKIINPANGKESTLTYLDADPLTGTFFGMKTCDVNNVVSAVEWDAFSISNDAPKPAMVAIR